MVNNKNDDALNKADAICKILVAHKGEDVLRLCVKDKSDVADYYVIASGRSVIHAKALTERVEEEMEKQGVFATRKDGVREGRWAVLDYGDVLVNVFSDEARLFYHLENLWGDDKNTVKY